MKNKLSATTYILLVVAILILVNILSDKFFLRLDFTEDSRYTLSNATKDILRSLKEPVTVTAYFTEDVPPEIAKVKRDFKDLLVEYGNISKGMVAYQFIDPNAEQDQEQKAMQAGVQPRIMNKREKDQVQTQKVYMGAVVSLGEQNDAIPFLEPGAAMEYSLSSSIKKISVANKTEIGFLQGHGEPATSSLQQVMAALNILYRVEPVKLSDSSANLTKFQTLAIVAPTDSFPPSHLQQLDNFLAKGGNLFIAINRVKGDLTKITGTEIKTGLERWLLKKGINVENSFIVDDNCAGINVRQQQGNYVYTTPVKFPYLPIINSFTDHPVTKGLTNVLLPFASPISYTGSSSNVTFTSLAKTSKRSGAVPPPVYFDVTKQWRAHDFPLSNLTVAGILSGNIVGSNTSKLIIISNGDFAVNGDGRSAQQQQPDNINLMVNSIDWLSDATGLIELRTKGVTSRPLDQISDGKKSFLKWFNFLLPLLLISIYGFGRFQQKRNMRMKRMEQGYI
ncbi:MAG: GldG family protein [Bacteroidia bacterium]|nr:GldG family protein [Bacteroidia bacterium]